MTLEQRAASFAAAFPKRAASGAALNVAGGRLPCGSYNAANCVTACWPCNRMKRTLSTAVFLATVARIAKHQLERQ